MSFGLAYLFGGMLAVSGVVFFLQGDFSVGLVMLGLGLLLLVPTWVIHRRHRERMRGERNW